MFRSLLPEWVHVADIDPRNVDPAMLLSEERVFVAGAVESRRREFAAGRILARGLLRSCGRAGPLIRRPEGPPSWPPGIVGSITHCRTLAAVAIASRRDCAGIGLDVEVNKPLPGDVVGSVLSKEEHAWTRADPVGVENAALRVFCAKEAFYKAIYPISGRFLDFGAVTIRPDHDGFVACLEVDAPPFAKGLVVKGSWRTAGGYVAAAVVIDNTVDKKFGLPEGGHSDKESRQTLALLTAATGEIPE